MGRPDSRVVYPPPDRRGYPQVDESLVRARWLAEKARNGLPLEKERNR
jgi:hypothetical protein